MSRVYLANRGSITHKQDPNKSVYGTKSDFYVDLEHPVDASTVVRQYISNFNLGASTFVGGQIIDSEGEMIGFVSYNGRLWDETSPYFKSEKIMFNKLLRKN